MARLNITSICRNKSAYSKLENLFREYFGSRDELIETLYDLLLIIDRDGKDYLRDNSDFTFRLYSFLRVAMAYEIGGFVYQRYFTPVLNSCYSFLQKHVDILDYLGKTHMDLFLSLAEEHLSVRAQNILKSITPIYAILYANNQEDLEVLIKSSRNCGVKTFAELLNYSVLIRTAAQDEIPVVLPKDAQDEPISPEKETLIKKRFAVRLAEISARSRNIIDAISSDYSSFIALRAQDIENAKSCGKKSAEEINRFQRDFIKEMNEIVALDSEEIAALSLQDKYPFLLHDETDIAAKFVITPDDASASLLKNRYEALLSSMSVRSRNIVELIATDYSSFISLNANDIESARYCGKKSIEEIKKCQKDFISEVCSIISLDSESIVNLDIHNKYPFLNDNDIEFVSSFEKTHGYIPCFRVLVSLIRSSGDRFTKIFINSYGIGTGPISLKEIGVKENLSYERVRQLSRKPSQQLVTFLHDSQWKSYAFWDNILLTQNSTQFDLIQNEEGILDFPFEAFVNLMSMVYDYEVLSIRDVTFAVNKRLNHEFDFKLSLSDMDNSLKAKHYGQSSVPIDTFISPYIIRYDKECDTLIPLFKDILHQMGFDTDKDDCVILVSNRLDLEDVLYGILAKEGNPMHIDSIFLSFKQLYPEHKYTSSNQLRPYLQRSLRICAQGKSSTYALTEWNLFSGSRRDYATELLTASPIPIPRQELIQKIQLRFPESSESSIASTISLSDQYQIYNGSLIGLVNKQYPDEYVANDFIGNRKDFDERLQDLIDFFEYYHYSPQSGSGAEEKSLYRWIYNTRSGRTLSTEDQLRRFNEVMDRYSDYCYSGDEYAFMVKCEEYKAYVHENYELPTKETNVELTKWFNKAMANQYVDKRSKLLDNLLEALTEYGFFV